jgi:hypothetical protein
MQDLFGKDYVVEDHRNEIADPNAIVKRSQTNFINMASTLASNPTTPLTPKRTSVKQK